MVVVAQNLAYAEPAVAPRPRPAAPPPPRRDVGWQLAELHERHAGELLRFCRWMLRDRDDAADALQDTWIRAMSALGEERVRVTAMRPWLYAIARNACLDRLRERKRASCHELDESALGDAPAADEVAGLRNEARAALALIGTLSERQRSALLMRELAGMSVPEIADALGLTVERAQWTIADARKALEASDGRALQCDVARERLARGARGRALRAHLNDCGDCRAHDRALRARRVLAPAMLPFLWLRRALRLVAPVAHPAAVAVVAATVVLPHAVASHHAPAPAPRHVAAPRLAAAPRPVVAARASEWHRVVRTSRPADSRVAPQAAPATVGRSESRHAVVRSPNSVGVAAKPVLAVPAARPVRVVRRVVETVKAPVAKVVDTVRRVAGEVPAAAPVVDRATGVVRQVVAGL